MNSSFITSWPYLIDSDGSEAGSKIYYKQISEHQDMGIGVGDKYKLKRLQIIRRLN